MDKKFTTIYNSEYNSLPNTEIGNIKEPFFEEHIYNDVTIPSESDSDIFALAKAFLAIEAMSNKKLQKLCYYAQAWHLALEDEPLVNGCEFQAWVHGPVCPELYKKYRQYGFSDIPQYIDKNIIINEECRSFAKEVYEAYGDMTGSELERLTHQEDPWIKARGDLKPWESCSTVISENDMKEYYRKNNV